MFTTGAIQVGRHAGIGILVVYVLQMTGPLTAPVLTFPNGSGFALTSAAADDSPHDDGLTLRLAYFDGAGLPAGARQAMEREVATIFAKVGVRVSAFDQETLTATGSDPRTFVLRVVILQEPPTTFGQTPITLGVYHRHRFPPASVLIFQPSIYAELGLMTEGEDYLPPDLIGRAFGRVVAHEVIHALAPDHKHRQRGVLACWLDREALLQSRLVIDEMTAEALRDGLARIEEALAADDEDEEKDKSEGDLSGDLFRRADRDSALGSAVGGSRDLARNPGPWGY